MVSVKIMEFDWPRCCGKDAFGKAVRAVNLLGAPGWAQGEEFSHTRTFVQEASNSIIT